MEESLGSYACPDTPRRQCDNRMNEQVSRRRWGKPPSFQFQNEAAGVGAGPSWSRREPLSTLEVLSKTTSRRQWSKPSSFQTQMGAEEAAGPSCSRQEPLQTLYQEEEARFPAWTRQLRPPSRKKPRLISSGCRWRPEAPPPRTPDPLPSCPWYQHSIPTAPKVSAVQQKTQRRRLRDVTESIHPPLSCSRPPEAHQQITTPVRHFPRRRWNRREVKGATATSSSTEELNAYPAWAHSHVSIKNERVVESQVASENMPQRVWIGLPKKAGLRTFSNKTQSSIMQHLELPVISETRVPDTCIRRSHLRWGPSLELQSSQRDSRLMSPGSGR